MNNLITPQEAFNAMVAGKNILCRAVGELMDFDDIDQFPATIFAKTGYEFCIKLDMIEVAGITFTKPLTIEEVMPGQDIFLVGNTGNITHGQFIAEYNELVSCIKNGAVQRDAENAEKQAKAIQAVLGVVNEITHSTVDFKSYMSGQSKPEKTTGRSKAKAKAPTTAVENTQITASNDVVEKTSQSSIQITAVDKTVIQEDNLVTFDDAKNQLSHEKSLRDRIAAALTISDLEALLPELQQLHGESGHLIMSQYENHKESLGVDEEEVKRLEILDDLLARAAVAQTQVEANALFKYVRNWTVEQQVPLQKAVSKRLCELAPVEVEAAPTLMDRIKSAPDLTTLDILEVDVGARSAEMQPKFMAEIVKRRRDLESQGVA